MQVKKRNWNWRRDLRKPSRNKGEEKGGTESEKKQMETTPESLTTGDVIRLKRELCFFSCHCLIGLSEFNALEHL